MMLRPCSAVLPLLVVGTISSTARGQSGAPGATTAPASRPTTTSPALDPELEQILDRLEKRGDTIADLSCAVRQEMKGLVVGELIVKEGEIRYLRGGEKGANSRFYIHFTRIMQDDYKLAPEWYVFDGRWFIEAKESTKNVIRREIVREGEQRNLFSVEDSPFPLPFGQRKAEILKQFDVKLVPPDPKDPPDSRHLLCIPRPGTSKEKEYAEVHFYIDPKLDLPVKIVAHRKTGAKVAEIHTVTFPDLSAKSINKGLPGSAFDFRPPSGWQVHTEYLDAKEPK